MYTHIIHCPDLNIKQILTLHIAQILTTSDISLSSEKLTLHAFSGLLLCVCSLRRWVRRDHETGDPWRWHRVPNSPVQPNRASGTMIILKRYNDNFEDIVGKNMRMMMNQWGRLRQGHHHGFFLWLWKNGNTDDDNNDHYVKGAVHNVEAQKHWREPTWGLWLLSLWWPKVKFRKIQII